MRDFSRFKRNQSSEPEIIIKDGKTTKVYYEEKESESSLINMLNEQDEEDDTFELFELLTELKGNLKDLYPDPIWVKGEISGWKKSGQHIYFDLVERDTNGNESAKINAKIWSANVNRVITKFKNQTEQDLKNGIKCEWLITLDYHPKYGLSFVVQDIKAIWTIGEHEKKLQKIREALKKEDLFDLQKQRLSPNVITRLAIVAPSAAAGLGDFKSEADIWEKNNLIQIDYQFAIFEGEKAKDSVSNAINYFTKKQKESFDKNGSAEYDLLIVLRGGGSKTSLAWLDEFDIAKEICLFNGPVWTAIGHEQDFSILDEISNKSIHTPSKAAQKIWDILKEEYLLIKNSKEIIKREIKYKLSMFEQNINNLTATINEKSQYKIKTVENNIDFIIEKMKNIVDMKSNNFENNIDNLIKRLLGLSPKETLKRGYAIISDKNGNTIKDKEDIKQGEDIDIIWANSKITIKNVNKED